MPVTPKYALVFNQQVELCRIIQELLSSLAYSQGQIFGENQWTAPLMKEMNTRLEKWHESLPSNMIWDNSATYADKVQPNVYSLKYVFPFQDSTLHLTYQYKSVQYHAARMSFNAPFLLLQEAGTTASLEPGKMRQLAQEVCGASIAVLVSILQHFHSEHGLRNAPIIFVFGAIIAINVTNASLRNHDHQRIMPENSMILSLEYFLQEMSNTWALAGDARTRFQKIRFDRQRTDL